MGIKIKKRGFTLISVVFGLFLLACFAFIAIRLISIQNLAASEAVKGALDSMLIVVIVIGILALATATLVLLLIGYRVDSKYYWYESLLDSIPFPISATDNDMNWTFINKPVEDMLKINRYDVLGKNARIGTQTFARLKTAV